MSIGKRKTGLRWTSALIKKLWLISWDQWADRNMRLHDTPLAENLAGALSLDRLIQAEWTKGTDNMPTGLKNTFTDSVENILQQPSKAKKEWFTLVRSYREVIGEGTDDEFGPAHKKMREWSGLAPSQYFGPANKKKRRRDEVTTQQ